MGWKVSLVIIENKNNFSDDKEILKSIGKSDYTFDSEDFLVDCIYPNDKSINIGYYNNNVIICDDYQITTDALERVGNLDLTIEEKALVGLFPNSEILSLACLSTVNYHAYSLIDSGKKKRLKICVPETLIEFGGRFKEEEDIYAKSFLKNGENHWVYDGEEYPEDTLMEEFIFAVAKRRLGVQLDDLTGEELMEKVVFKKYIKTNKNHVVKELDENVGKPKWIKYGIFFLIFVIWQILKRTILKN